MVPRAARLISALERPVVPSDRTARRLALAAFVVYFFVGWKIEATGTFKANDVFFNADCDRVFAAVFHPDQKSPSYAVGSGHPLVGLIFGPVVALSDFVFRGAEDLPVRLLCHAAAACAVALGYGVLRVFGAPRWLATWGAAVYAISCSQLVLGSIIEIYAFVALAVAASLLVAARSDGLLRNALLGNATFGLNVALAPHALLMPPVLWLGRMPLRRWLGRTLLFVVGTACLAVVFAKLQELVYPGTGFFFKKDALADYGPWWSVPNTRAAALHRAARVVPHFFAFDVVAPVPLYSEDSKRMTSFMLEAKDLVARYDGFGGVVAGVWIASLLVATFYNVRGLFRGDRAVRARVVLLGGWLLGTFGLFMVFGDDVLLYSPMWTLHFIVWIVLGLSTFASANADRERWARFAAFAFVLALAANNAVFVSRMLAKY